jgi:carboxymethylenebutenolidase
MSDVREAPDDALGRYETYRSSADGAEIKSYLVKPAAEKAPAVLMLRGVAGPDSGYIRLADHFAAAGFAALIHHWQIRGNDPEDRLLLQDIDAAIAFLRGQAGVDSERIAAIGYCKGGGQALLAAAEFPAIRAVVAFHGLARRTRGADEARCNPIDAVPRIRQPVLLLHGEKDGISPVTSMRDLTAALQGEQVSVELHTYPSADHGFAVSTHKGFQEPAASDSFVRAIAFLNRALR